MTGTAADAPYEHGSPPGPGGARITSHLQLGLSVVIGVAVVGFFVGLGGGSVDNGMRTGAGPVLRSPTDAVLRSMSYAEVGARGLGPNRDHVSELAELRSPPMDAALRADPAARAESLAARAGRRAFNGAPPVVPHPVDTVDARSCLACHGDGLRVSSRSAGKVPHAHYVNCLQCHAEAETSVPGGRGVDPATSFVGVPAPTHGPRAFAGAPPWIPHSTWMRADCLSCHGPNGSPGMQTTHPERRSCLQCHAVSAELEQAVGGPR